MSQARSNIRYPATDFTTRPNPGFARPSGAATFESATGRVGWSHVHNSDPSTGALSARGTTQLAAPSSMNLKNFWFVVGLLFVTMWLESGKRGGLL